MRNKIVNIFLILICLNLISGCSKAKDNNEQIYTGGRIYADPIEHLEEYLRSYEGILGYAIVDNDATDLYDFFIKGFDDPLYKSQMKLVEERYKGGIKYEFQYFDYDVKSKKQVGKYTEYVLDMRITTELTVTDNTKQTKIEHKIYTVTQDKDNNKFITDIKILD